MKPFTPIIGFQQGALAAAAEWRDEFELAAARGFALMEWVGDETADDPLMSQIDLVHVGDPTRGGEPLSAGAAELARILRRLARNGCCGDLILKTGAPLATRDVIRRGLADTG